MILYPLPELRVTGRPGATKVARSPLTVGEDRLLSVMDLAAVHRRTLRLTGRSAATASYPPDSRGWRAADAVMLLLFTLGAVVQLNDPDSLRWIAVYALAAAACLLSLLRRLHRAFPTLLCAIALGWAATLAPRVVGRVPFRDMFGAFEMRSVGIEESREMYGLLIIAAWMAVLAVRARRGSPRALS